MGYVEPVPFLPPSAPSMTALLRRSKRFVKKWCPKLPHLNGVTVQGEEVFLGNPEDSVWEDWGTLGKT